MSIDYEKEYIEWFNDYLTVEKFAEHKGLTVDQAQIIIDLGRKINRERDKK